ncbi:UNVERIFIED_ORG: RNA polymerase sigma-70 factor [Xanthomonas phage Xoo-sp15]
MFSTLEKTRLTDKETLQYIKEAQKGSEEAKEKLIGGYYDLVYSIIHKRHTSKEDFDDAFQTGVWGLLEAVERFDVSAENAFMTYAYHYISGYLSRDMRNSKMIRVPVRVYSLAAKIVKNDLLKSPIEDISEELDEPNLEYVSIALDYIKNGKVVSTNEVIFSKGEGNDITIEETLSSDLNGENWQDHVDVRACMTQLNEMDRQVITLYFFENQNTTQVGERLGISQNYASRVKNRALKTLKNHLDGTTEKIKEKKETTTEGKDYAIRLLQTTTMTQREISKVAGVSKAFVARWSKTYRSKEVSLRNKKQGAFHKGDARITITL